MDRNQNGLRFPYDSRLWHEISADVCCPRRLAHDVVCWQAATTLATAAEDAREKSSAALVRNRKRLRFPYNYTLLRRRRWCARDLSGQC
eukprot:COSAG01_NODE_21979_length_877_cov_1.071979_2_plen_89_part_00